MQEHRPFLPYGFQFRPSDEELIVHYLLKKVSGTLLPIVGYFIRDCGLYDKKPSEIWKSHGGSFLNVDEDLYFFTQLKKSSSKGSRFSRKVGSSGSWQGEDAAKDIVTGKSNLKIGSKKRFRYENKGSEDHGGWIMHEYTLHPSMVPQNQATNYVLCRLRKNKPTEKQQKLALSKKRKLLDFQNNQYEKELEKILTQQLTSVECQPEAAGSAVTMAQEEPICSTDNYNKFKEKLDKLLNNVECKSEAAESVVTMAQEDACCATDNDMMSEQVVSAHQCDFNSSTLERKEIGGIYYTQNADEQDGVLNNMVLSNHQCVPHNGSETTGGINYSCNIYAVGEQYDVQMPVPGQTVQTWSMLQQECSSRDPLEGLTEEDFCLLRKIFHGKECEEAMVTEVEQEARCDTGMNMSEQSLSGTNDPQTGGMDYSTSVAEQQNAEAITIPDQLIHYADRVLTKLENNQLRSVNNLECQCEGTMVMMSKSKEILSDNPCALENGNLESQETGGIGYDMPMEVGDEILQSVDIVQYED